MPQLQAPSLQALQALRALAFPSSLASTCSRAQAHHLRQGGSHIGRPRPSRALHSSSSLPSSSSSSSSSRPSGKPTNPNAPKHHDRGPPSSESTQTDFSKLDIFQSFNVPVPATSIDACTSDGFHLNNNVKITGYDGVLLVGGEAFSWSPHKAKEGGKELLQLDAKGVLTLTPESLSLLSVLYPKPDLLLIGTGARLWMISKATRDYLNSELGIRVDIMDTANASSAYNLLAQERGVEQGSGVGAALLPISWKGR